MLTILIIITTLILILPLFIFLAAPKDVLKDDYQEEKVENVDEDYIKD